MKNGNKTLALSITSFQILCFVPIFQFPLPRARYRRSPAVLVTLRGQRTMVTNPCIAVFVIGSNVDKGLVPYYMKFSRHVNFANFAIQKIAKLK